MFEAILGISALATLVLLITWWLAGYLAGRLAFRRTRGRLQLAAGVLLALLGLAALVTAAAGSQPGHHIWHHDEIVTAANAIGPR